MEENKQKGKQDHTVRYIVYAAAAYFGLQYLFKPKRATATVVALPTTKEVVADEREANTTVNPIVVPSQSSGTMYTTESFPLRRGMRGQRVQALQQKLGVKADGIFGSETQAALFKQFGITTVTASQYPSIMLSKLKATSQAVQTSRGLVLKRGSKGVDVYRLQQWLGFKDKAAARSGERVADSDFGQQTEAVLLSKTGQSSISVAMLNQYLNNQKGSTASKGATY